MSPADTEGKILAAAEEIFVQKGMDGSRMHEIADRAGINKALLHYYFRSKEKLFLRVFKLVFPRVLPKTLEIFMTDLPFQVKLEQFIDRYITLISRNQQLPLFVIGELAKNPDAVIEVMKETQEKLGGNLVEAIEKDIRREIEKGTIIDIDPRQLFVNVLSLCVFPFVGRPIITYIGFDNNDKSYDEFLNTRKKEVFEFVMRSITPEKVKNTNEK